MLRGLSRSEIMFSFNALWAYLKVVYYTYRLFQVFFKSPLSCSLYL